MERYIASPLILFLVACGGPDPTDAPPLIDAESQALAAWGDRPCAAFEIVRLRGKLNFFGLDLLASPPAPRPYATGVAQARVWIAEYPFTRYLGITSDVDGYWDMWLLKRRDRPLEISFVYEKDFYDDRVESAVFGQPLPSEWRKVKIRSNMYRVASDDILDVAIQMPDELYLYAAKTALEQAIEPLIGAPYPIENLVVSTVGKAWASLFDPRLPHGDPGAVVTLDPPAPSALAGPIYFDESVTPNPLQILTSVDGGVLFNNLTPGEYTMSAAKDGVTYENVRFKVGSRVNLYVSSPPHSIQGSNPSGPGEE